mgnify:CR=1 FL=1
MRRCLRQEFGGPEGLGQVIVGAGGGWLFGRRPLSERGDNAHLDVGKLRVAFNLTTGYRGVVGV